MSNVLVLSQKDIEAVLTMDMALRAVEEAYRQKSAGSACLFPMVFHEFDPGKADMDIKSGHLAGSGIYGLKLVSWYGGNPGKGLPALFGTTLLFDDRTGEPLALLNAGGITGMRTGAAGAIGAKTLARPDSETLLMVGTGEQAPYQIAATLLAMPGVKRVLLHNPRNPSHTAMRLPALQAEVEPILAGAAYAGTYQMEVREDLAGATAESDVIITATPARSPLIRAEWLRPGTHISCVGADMSGKQELDGQILQRARVYADDIAQSVSVGECEMPIKQGLIAESHIRGEIGAVIGGALEGRTDAEQITVFDSTGIALQDLIVSKQLVDLARERGVGIAVTL